jgi:hypothetical protein
MSRRSPRIRARFAATVHIAGVEHTLVCHTRDISAEGCFLDTAEMIAPGVGLSLALMDNERGEVVQVDGVVARCLPGGVNGVGRGVGVRLTAPPPSWQLMVQRYQQSRAETEPGVVPTVRLAILVVGEEDQRRGALALYVRSGWDVRFATDVPTAEEAMAAVDLDAVIAEYDLDDSRALEVLQAARRLQPDARRFVRSAVRNRKAPGGGDVIQAIIDRDAGLEALVEALSAAFGTERALR